MLRGAIELSIFGSEDIRLIHLTPLLSSGQSTFVCPTWRRCADQGAASSLVQPNFILVNAILCDANVGLLISSLMRHGQEAWQARMLVTAN